MAIVQAKTGNGYDVLAGSGADLEVLIKKIIKEEDKKKYPVGKIIMQTTDENPSTYLGFGTWQRWGNGRVPVGVDESQTEFNTVNKTGGSKTHTLTVEQIPSHNHIVEGVKGDGEWAHGVIWLRGAGDQTKGYPSTQYTGGSQAHNNLQPYITCYMWKRIS